MVELHWEERTAHGKTVLEPLLLKFVVAASAGGRGLIRHGSAPLSLGQVQVWQAVG